MVQINLIGRRARAMERLMESYALIRQATSMFHAARTAAAFPLF